MLAAGGWLGWRAWEHGGARRLPFRDVTATVGVAEWPRPTHKTYHAAGELRKDFRKVMPGRVPRLPPIDFGRQEAYLVAAGPRSSSGYELRVLRVVERRGDIQVVIRERAPRLGEPVDVGLTYPYRLITFRRSTKTVHLVWLGRP
jgi:hypothetical protein